MERLHGDISVIVVVGLFVCFCVTWLTLWSLQWRIRYEEQRESAKAQADFILETLEPFVRKIQEPEHADTEGLGP